MGESAEKLKRHVLREPHRGRVFETVKVISWVELALFAGLMFVWLSPGMHTATFWFGLSHGIGFIVLCLAIWGAVLAHQAPYWLLAMTLTPVGPVGSVIGIEIQERRWRGGAVGGRGSARPAPTPARR